MYITLPLHNGYSLSQLLMNRKLHTPLPIIETQLVPSVPDYSIIQDKETQYKTNNKNNFHTCHRASPLDPLDLGQSVWITGRRDNREERQ